MCTEMVFSVETLSLEIDARYIFNPLPSSSWTKVFMSCQVKISKTDSLALIGSDKVLERSRTSKAREWLNRGKGIQKVCFALRTSWEVHLLPSSFFNFLFGNNCCCC